jgi:DNA-directed RNA polymerase specialized sigma24 family protein
MNIHSQYCNANISEKETSETILKRHDRYIVTQVKKFMGHNRHSSYQEVADLEIDELIQLVRIKFWRALEKGHVHYHHAYINRIINSEFIDMKRRRKPILPLSLDEGEEYYHSECQRDPADEVMQKIEGSSLLNEAVQLVMELPPRQRQAMMCLLQDQVDDLLQLVDAFKRYRIDIKAIRWPDDKAEKQLLQASLSPARRTLTKKMKKDVQPLNIEA